MPMERVRLGAGGRAVIPAACREALALSEGDELVLMLEDGSLSDGARREMDKSVLDASALLALLLREPGYDVVLRCLPGALMRWVHLAGVLTKLEDEGMPAQEALAACSMLPITVCAFGHAEATGTAALRHETRRAGLSPGDRACLQLARSEHAQAITADRGWSNLDLNTDAVVVRP